MAGGESEREPTPYNTHIPTENRSIISNVLLEAWGMGDRSSSALLRLWPKPTRLCDVRIAAYFNVVGTTFFSIFALLVLLFYTSFTRAWLNT